MSAEIAEKLAKCLQTYLHPVWHENWPWKIDCINGNRGIYATRDIQVNELILYDLAFAIGPSAGPNKPIVCVICFKPTENLCSKGCSMPVCVACRADEYHRQECALLKSWQPREATRVSFERMRALTAIRVFLRDDGIDELLNLMQHNKDAQDELSALREEFDNFPRDRDTINRLRQIIATIKTNAFIVRMDAADICALYPLSGFMNHRCTPNTRRGADRNFVHSISASRNIRKGEEIVLTYSELMWNTYSRRIHLFLTKQFLCDCSRCADITENGTMLSALQCLNKSCQKGNLLPLDPLSFKSSWKCNDCKEIFDHKQIQRVQNMLAMIAKTFLRTKRTFDEFIDFLDKRVAKLAPPCNQIAVEIKSNFLWKFNEIEIENGKFGFIFW